MDQNKLVEHTLILDKNPQELPDDLKKIVDQMHEYLGQKKANDPKEIVALILLVMAIMDVPEKSFMNSIDRMNRIIINSYLPPKSNGPLN